MRKLFEIDESEKQRILEMHINASKNHYLIEQDVNNIETIDSGNAISDWQVCENLEKDINKLLQSVQNEIFEQITLKYVSGPNNIDTDNFVFSVINNDKNVNKLILNYENVTDTKNQIAYNMYVTYLRSIGFGTTPISQYLKPIFKNEDYVILFEKYPSLEKIVRNLTVDLTCVPNEYGSIAIGGKIRSGKGEFSLDEEIPFGYQITRSKVDGGQTIFKIKLNRVNYFSLEFNNARMTLAEIKLPNPGVKPSEVDTTPKPRDRFVPRSVGGNTGEPFNFNSTILASDGQKQLQKFVDQFLIIKRTDPDLYNTYIDYLNKYYGKDGKINVYAYSSIDDDPNQTITYVEGPGGNAVDKCGGKQLRSKYNKCLSDRRAEVIAAELNKQLPDFPDFIGIGKGESKSVNGVGWTKESPTTEPQTLPNRRFEVELPEYSDIKSAN
jgi:outer membrane protein OmpA-like peptidoglycan-associated protein